MSSKEVQIKKNDNKEPAVRANSYFEYPDMERMMERFFDDPFGAWADLPAMNRRSFGDVRETENAYVLSAEIPGIPKEDVKVSVEGNLLTIRAEHSEQNDDAKEQAQNRTYRRSYRSFRQSFSLPNTVDPSAIEAHCENGVLEVLMPKTQSAAPKNVEVQTGKGGFLSRLMDKTNIGSDKKAQEQAKKH